LKAIKRDELSGDHADAMGFKTEQDVWSSAGERLRTAGSENTKVFVVRIASMVVELCGTRLSHMEPLFPKMVTHHSSFVSVTMAALAS
jgi:hypothetical protein